jgi:O-antigen ligase
MPAIMLSITFMQGGADLDFTDATGDTLNQVISIFILANSLLFVRIFRIPLGKIALALIPLFPIAVWMLLSARWSEFPDLTVRRSAREAIELVSLSLVAMSFSEERSLLRVIYWSFLFTLLLNVLSLAFPGRSFSEGTFYGIYGNKNLLGAFVFYALPALSIGILRRSVSTFRVVATGAVLLAMAMLAFSHSKSAVGCVALAACLAAGTRLSFLGASYNRILVPILAALGVAAVATIIADLGLSDALILAFGDATLTGRDQVWAYALGKHDLHPMQGVGYGALWQLGPQMLDVLQHAQVRWIANQSHDGYVDIVSQLGWVGIAFLAIYLLASFNRLVKYVARTHRGRTQGVADYAMYIFWGALIYNITESSFFRAGHPLWVIFLLLNGFVGGQLAGGVGRVARRHLTARSNFYPAKRRAFTTSSTSEL